MESSGIDPTTVIAIVFGVIAVAAFVIYRHRMNLRARVGTSELEINGGNEPSGSRHDVELQDITSKNGRFDYEDDTGDSLKAKKVKVKGDVSFKRTAHEKESPRPK